MIVYGDASFEAEICHFAHFIRSSLPTGPGATELGPARTLVVVAGQLEQALCDRSHIGAADSRRLTRLTARAFVNAWLGIGFRYPRSEVLDLLRRIEGSAGGAGVRARLPEGFTCYALYPDAYAQTAFRWARSVPGGTRVLVVGLRSIGTTLGAVVSAALEAGGLTVTNFTVRPDGPPFARRVCLPHRLELPDRAIVVDEGPGLSGSSMVAVASALVEAGLSEERISFFPAHDKGPGTEGTDEVRASWRRIRAHATPLNRVRLGQANLLDVLRTLASRALDEPIEGELADLSGGRWQDEAGVEAAEAHAIAPCFEQPKFLARGASGEAILLKYAGIAATRAPNTDELRVAAEHTLARLARLADEHLTVAARGSAHGWLAIPWLHGRRLTRADADQTTIAAIGRYIAKASGPVLSRTIQEEAVGRLVAILTTNAPELVGPAYRDAACRVGGRLAVLTEALALPSCGDGRLAPHEWVLTKDRHLIKVDAGGHEQDHTMIGPQSILWDIAGAMVEWNFSRQSTAALISAAQIETPSEVLLACYGAAYAAFRAAMAMLAGGESSERGSIAFYRSRLQTELTKAAYEDAH